LFKSRIQKALLKRHESVTFCMIFWESGIVQYDYELCNTDLNRDYPFFVFI
jgi:hypothetical protein